MSLTNEQKVAINATPTQQVLAACKVWGIEIPEEKTRCHADSDGECFWEHCPQLRDKEPHKSGRHCPLDIPEEKK